MKKKSAKKELLIVFGIIAVVVIAGAVLLFGDYSSDGVELYSASGELFATAELKGDKWEAELHKEGAYDYAMTALEETERWYSETEKMNTEDARKYVSRKVKKINTYLDTEILGEVYGVYKEKASSSAGFSAVITDTQGKLLAMYGNGEGAQCVCSAERFTPGSALKPLSVFAPAIELGRVCWSTTLTDSPVKKVSDSNGNMVDWPVNNGGVYSGEEMTVCQALKTSTNTIAVKILQQIGTQKCLDVLNNRFGMRLSEEYKLVEEKGQDEVLGNLALGYLRSGLSPTELCGYYQVFVNGGMYTEPYTVSSVEEKGGELKEKTLPQAERVFSEETSFIMREMMKRVMHSGGTGVAANVTVSEFCGKTGTTTGYENNWFVGCSPEYVCTIWHGNDGTQSNNASEYCGEIINRLPCEKTRFDIEEDVRSYIYCEKTGKIAGKGCEKTSSGFYTSQIPRACDCK